MLTQENAHYRLPKGGRTRLIAAFTIALLAIGGLWWNAQAKAHRELAARTVAERRADQLDAASTALQKRTAALLKANHRLLVHGQKPVAVPNVPSLSAGPRGPEGQQGQPGPSPTRAQVFAAVSLFCSSGACEHGPSASQVETAVADYCASRNQCRGPVGADGSQGAVGAPGTDGTNGTNGQPGPQGQPGQNATDAQVQAAVNTYCNNHNGCQGPPGAQGAQGDVGPQGPKGDPGTAVPGTYTCPDVTPFVHGLTVAQDGSVSLDCINVLDGIGPN